MIFILGVVGSPRIEGNTELLVAESLKVAEENGATTELLRLANKEVKPCDACLSCRKTKECRIKDDFNHIFNKMVRADGIILATPVYVGSATSQIKALIDRAAYLSIARGRVFENKVGGAIVVGTRNGQNFTFAQLLFFFLIQGMIVPGSSYWNVSFGKEKGEVIKDEKGLKTVRDFGKKMVWLISRIKVQKR